VTVRLRVEGADPTPPYEQLRRQLATAIEAGVLADGARLPSVRRLAADLSLAVGTVARAYAALERGGFVRSRRGAGTTVVHPGPASGEKGSAARAAELVGKAVLEARLLGLADAQVREAVERALASGEEQIYRR